MLWTNADSCSQLHSSVRLMASAVNSMIASSHSCLSAEEGQSCAHNVLVLTKPHNRRNQILTHLPMTCDSDTVPPHLFQIPQALRAQGYPVASAKKTRDAKVQLTVRGEHVP